VRDRLAIVEEKLDASKVMFFEHKQYHRLPAVIGAICEAIGKPKLYQDMLNEIETDPRNFHNVH
jgi:hypothetical protein